VLCFILLPVFGIVSVNLLPFFCGSVLLLVRHPARWVTAAAVIATVPLLAYLAPGDLATSGIQLQWSVYACATFAAASLVVYGLGRFVRASAELAHARQRLAETAVTRERVRIARDTHDTLGLALSAIALKSDLAQALLTRDPERARREIVQTIHLSRTVAADAESIVNGDLTLHLDAELAAADDVLRAAGTNVSIDRDPVPLSSAVETELAAMLREAVANVLRHSDARTCSIRVTRIDRAVELEVINDGAHETGLAGRGLDNIQERATALGGSAVYSVAGGRFTLDVRVPREQIAAVTP
jgi:two-component system sensor histidine kinase DesK